MFGFLTGRVYIIIAVCVAAVCAAIVYLDQNHQFADFFREIGRDAVPFLGTNISNVIFEPLAQVFSNYYWAIAGGILWPILALWFLLMIVGLIATVIGPAFKEVTSI